MRGGPDGRTTARWRGKSGLHKATVPGNARPGQPEGKRHRKQTALQSVRGSHGVRVKRWGKSPPRDGQPDRHGKPHREQCRIGTASRAGLGPAVRVGSTSLLATAGPDEWSSPGQPGTESGLQALRAYSTILFRRLAQPAGGSAGVSCRNLHFHGTKMVRLRTPSLFVPEICRGSRLKGDGGSAPHYPRAWRFPAKNLRSRAAASPSCRPV